MRGMDPGVLRICQQIHAWLNIQNLSKLHTLIGIYKILRIDYRLLKSEGSRKE